jgi:hypothetical protein
MPAANIHDAAPELSTNFLRVNMRLSPPSFSTGGKKFKQTAQVLACEVPFRFVASPLLPLRNSHKKAR